MLIFIRELEYHIFLNYNGDVFYQVEENLFFKNNLYIAWNTAWKQNAKRPFENIFFSIMTL